MTISQCYLGYLAIQTDIVRQINFIKGIRMNKLIFALIAAVAAVGSAQAADQAAGPYVGVGVASAAHYDLAGATGAMTSASTTSRYKASGKIFGGYDFNQTWGVEAGYTDIRKSDYNYTLSDGTTTGTAKAGGNAFYVAGKATLPINAQFSAYGKLGVTDNQRTLSDANTAAFNTSQSNTELYGAVGVQYKLNQQVAVVAEYERYGKSKDFGAKANVLTVGAKYAF